jgi:hypothetical protein
VLLLLAGLTRRNAEIEDPPTLPATESHAVLKHVHLANGYRSGMFDDASIEHRRRFIARRLHRIVRRIHDDRDPGDYVIDADVMCHPAGTAREDKLVLILKSLQSEAKRMHGETLLHEGSATKHLRHENRLERRLSGNGLRT